jgi:hypothetical protein
MDFLDVIRLELSDSPHASPDATEEDPAGAIEELDDAIEVNARKRRASV